MDFVTGSIVKSKAGHDKDSFYLVLEVLDRVIMVCDGKHHKLENPKKKNPKHLCVTKTVVELPQTNKQIRKMLNAFKID